MVLIKEPTPRLSFRALIPSETMRKDLARAKDSALTTLKAKIFESAEETAKRSYARLAKEKAKFSKSLEGALTGGLSDEAVEEF